MLSKLYSGALIGAEATTVEVEVNSGQKGEAKIFIVGLPDTAVKESIDRVSAAIVNTGFEMPSTKITINLAPSDIRKEGSTYDLPIALGILMSTGYVAQKQVQDYIIAGELSLSGALRPVKGAISLALLARKLGMRGVILPSQSAKEALLVDNIEVRSANSLGEICEFFDGKGELEILPNDNSVLEDRCLEYGEDFADVKGQEVAKRAVEVAVAGSHNILMMGSPGSGKSMIAKRIPSIMPLPSKEEFLETLGIYSACGMSEKILGRSFARPFRSPHHSISDVGLIGGGSNPKPGEISLAHNGVLFLDEFPEFKRSVLELLRQPLEDGNVCISRAMAKVELKSNFMLVAAMNPCPCGYFGDRHKKCHCSLSQIQRYQSKISGPLTDRIDIHIKTSALSLSELSKARQGESSQSIRERITKARQIQAERFKDEKFASAAKDNSNMNPAQIRKYCQLGKEQTQLLERAMTELKLSARAWNKIIKVSRTIADLEASHNIEPMHILEAINYRNIGA